MNFCRSILRTFIQRGSIHRFNYFFYFNTVEELLEYYHIQPTNIITEEKKDGNIPEKKQQVDELPVVYAGNIKEYKNIFKHIIIFTNDDDPKGNKTLKNIYEAIENLKKDKCEIIPELHVFIAAEIDADEDEAEIRLYDGEKEYIIKEESNLDTLIFLFILPFFIILSVIFN